MKPIYVAICLLYISSLCCTSKKTEEHSSTPADSTTTGSNPQKELTPSLQMLLDSANLIGVILVYKQAADTYYASDFSKAQEGHLPASTFKIANSIIGLEIGVVDDENTVIKWDGKKKWRPEWEQDLALHDAFHLSCVPCYQQIARKIGATRMNDYLSRLQYGHMDVSAENIDMFWLEGKSYISAYEEVQFLMKLYSGTLAVSARTLNIMKKMMVIKQTPDYTLNGKTGWSIDHGDNGWFVGYVETHDGVSFFAVNITPTPAFNMDNFGDSRKELAVLALKKLNIASITL